MLVSGFARAEEEMSVPSLTERSWSYSRCGPSTLHLLHDGMKIGLGGNPTSPFAGGSSASPMGAQRGSDPRLSSAWVPTPPYPNSAAFQFQPPDPSHEQGGGGDEQRHHTGGGLSRSYGHPSSSLGLAVSGHVAARSSRPHSSSTTGPLSARSSITPPAATGFGHKPSGNGGETVVAVAGSEMLGGLHPHVEEEALEGAVDGFIQEDDEEGAGVDVEEEIRRLETAGAVRGRIAEGSGSDHHHHRPHHHHNEEGEKDTDALACHLNVDGIGAYALGEEGGDQGDAFQELPPGLVSSGRPTSARRRPVSALVPPPLASSLMLDAITE